MVRLLGVPVLVASSVACCVALAACSKKSVGNGPNGGTPDGGTGGNGSEPRSYTGRVMLDVAGALPPDLTPDEQRLIEQQTGGTVDAARHKLLLQRSPAAGYLVKVGAGLVQTDADGYFRIPDLPAGSATIEVRQEAGGALQLTAPLDPAGFDVKHESDAPLYPVVFDVPSPGDMNPPARRTPRAPHHDHLDPTLPDAINYAESCFPPYGFLEPVGCAKHCEATNACSLNDLPPGCCADYNGVVGDGLPRHRSSPSRTPDIQQTCNALALKNFPGSTCFNWSFGVFGTTCLGEGAYHCSELLHDPLPKECTEDVPCGAGGACATAHTICKDGNCIFPSCFFLHKYRNCQNLDSSAFQVTPTFSRLGPGETLQLQLVNNTEFNETAVVMTGAPFEALSLPGKPPGPSLVPPRVLHYDDAELKHYKNANLTFTAPPNGDCTPKVVAINFVAGKRIQPSIVLIKGSSGLRAPAGCPTACGLASGVIGDALSISCNISNWSQGDAIAPGDGTIDGTMVVGNFSGGGTGDLRGGVGRGGIETSGTFAFLAECSGGGGACGAAAPVGTALCDGVTASNPRLRLAKIDSFLVDSLFVDGVHARVQGALVITPQRPRSLIETKRGDLYSYFWADRDSKVKGTCSDGSYDLDLKRGWNSVHANANHVVTGPVPADAKVWLLNALTVGP